MEQLNQKKSTDTFLGRETSERTAANETLRLFAEAMKSAFSIHLRPRLRPKNHVNGQKKSIDVIDEPFQIIHKFQACLTSSQIFWPFI